MLNELTILVAGIFIGCLLPVSPAIVRWAQRKWVERSLKSNRRRYFRDKAQCLIPDLKFTKDGSSKTDYDGPILEVSCRMYGAENSTQVSGCAAILLRANDGYYTLRELNFHEAPFASLTEAKMVVSSWAVDEYRKIAAFLLANYDVVEAVGSVPGGVNDIKVPRSVQGGRGEP